jgi:hypothetical protein
MPSPTPPDKYAAFMCQLLIPDKAKILKRLLVTIEKWNQVADAEFEAFIKETESDRQESGDDYGYDPIEEEGFTFLHTKRAIYGSLAVTITSTAEWFLIYTCETLGLEYLNKKTGLSDLKVIAKSLKKHLGKKLSTFPGFAAREKARILGNCFKHNGGRTNKEYVIMYGGDKKAEIEYENENWNDLIDKTIGFMTALAEKV